MDGTLPFTAIVLFKFAVHCSSSLSENQTPKVLRHPIHRVPVLPVGVEVRGGDDDVVDGFHGIPLSKKLKNLSSFSTPRSIPSAHSCESGTASKLGLRWSWPPMPAVVAPGGFSPPLSSLARRFAGVELSLVLSWSFSFFSPSRES